MKIFSEPASMTLVDKDGDKYKLAAAGGGLTIRRYSASTGSEQMIALFLEDAESFAEHLVAFAKKVRG